MNQIKLEPKQTAKKEDIHLVFYYFHVKGNLFVYIVVEEIKYIIVFSSPFSDRVTISDKSIFIFDHTIHHSFIRHFHKIHCVVNCDRPIGY